MFRACADLLLGALLLTLLGCVSCAAASWPTRAQRTAAAKQMGFGESAPDWLVQSETYAIGNADDWDALAASKVAFVTHCPVNREYFARLHALGIRAFPYVTFYQGFATRSYEGLNLKEHPEFIEVDEQGSLKRTGFWESEDAKNMYTTCPDVQGYQDAMVAWVDRIMALGADGVFVDNLGSRAPCFGPKFGKHKHVYGDANHAFAMLLKRVRATVKRHKPDGAILGNSASPLSLPKEYWKYLDAEMLESYICTWVSKDRWFDWRTHWHEQGVKLQPHLKAGKQIQALSYVGSTPYGIREDSFYCYGTARLAGFVWNGGRPLSDPDSSILYQIRLGPPLGPEREENGVFYRLYGRGLVAVNPNKEKAGAISIAAPAPTTRLRDLFGNSAEGWASVGRGGGSLDSAAPHSGARCLRLSNPKGEEVGMARTVTLSQKVARDLVASAWSRAEGVSGEPSPNYSLYLDVHYGDGTHLFGQVARFACGTHDWERQTVTIHPEKPVQSATVNILLRGHAGTAWFDDVSLTEVQGDEGGPELLANGGFEDAGRHGHLVDVAATGGRLEIPAFSGRVYLYASETKDELYAPGPTLTVATEPGLGEVRFRVDGFDYWTHCGMWSTEYVLGTNFGRFQITLDRPGKHTVEIVDVVPADMKTPKGYGSGERLGQFMDPSQPTRPSGGRKFRFREWAGPLTSRERKVEVDVKADTTLRALFDIEDAAP